MLLVGLPWKPVGKESMEEYIQVALGQGETLPTKNAVLLFIWKDKPFTG